MYYMEQESPAHQKQVLGSLLCLHSNLGGLGMRIMRSSFPRCTSNVWCTPPQKTKVCCHQPNASSKGENETLVQPTLLNYPSRPARCSFSDYQIQILRILQFRERCLLCCFACSWEWTEIETADPGATVVANRAGKGVHSNLGRE